MSFRDGFAEPRQLWGGLETPLTLHYRPQTVIADIDADGRLEIVVASALHSPGIGLMVVALDALTGTLKRQVNFSNGDRNDGHLQAIKTGYKPQLDVLAIGMLGRPHVTFFSNVADRMREVWHINETIQISYNPVADVDALINIVGAAVAFEIPDRCVVDGNASVQRADRNCGRSIPLPRVRGFRHVKRLSWLSAAGNVQFHAQHWPLSWNDRRRRESLCYKPFESTPKRRPFGHGGNVPPRSDEAGVFTPATQQ